MTVRVRVPASVANFGPAFDALAIAISVHNELEVDLAPRPEVIVEGEGTGTLPLGDANLAYRAAAEVARYVGVGRHFFVRCRNDIPIGRGLGSSAAAIIGGAVAANALLHGALTPAVLLEIAARLEGHPDNVAAALLGGAVILARNGDHLVWARLLPAWDAEFVVAIPQFAVPTALARAVLADPVPLRDAVANVGRTALLVASLATGRSDVLEPAMEDALHQPHRAPLVPGMAEVFAAARQAGALGVALSGSGPAIIAVCPSRHRDAIGAAMVRAFALAGQASYYLHVAVDIEGATVMEPAS